MKSSHILLALIIIIFLLAGFFFARKSAITASHTSPTQGSSTFSSVPSSSHSDVPTNKVTNPKNSTGTMPNDARRQADLNQIYTALQLYDKSHGYLPVTSSYGEANVGGWDYSSEGQFLPFLQDEKYLSTVPVDPFNNGTDDVFYGGSGYAYAYYCYPGENSLSLGAKLENGTILWKSDHETGFTCK